MRALIRARVRGLVVMSGALLVFAVGGGVALALTERESHRSTPPLIEPSDSDAVPAEAASAPPLASIFGVLEQPQQANDAVGATSPGHDGLVTQGVDPSKARLMTSLSGWGAWLVPGDGVVCLYAALTTNAVGGGSACPYVAQGADGFNLTIGGGTSNAAGIPANHVLLAGVVPDGVNAVEVAFKDGGEQKLGVVRNAYLAVVPGDAVSVSYDDSNGRQSRLVASCGAC